MRVARVSAVPYTMATLLAAQLDALLRAGFSVTVITSSGPELDGLRVKIPDLETVPVEIPRRISPLRDLQALVRLFLALRRGRFDIVHSVTPKAGLLCAVAARLAGTSVRLHTFTGQPWVGMSGPLCWLARASDCLVARLNTHCYADSESQRRFLVEQGVSDPARLSVLGPGSVAGVDLERFDPARFPGEERSALRRGLGVPPEAPVLLFVGRLTVDKGVRELLAAFRGLKAAGSPAHLVLVGPFDSDSGVGGGVSRADVEGAADVHALGHVDSPESYMAIADILCLPSYREGFGSSVIEAAAMGVPAVGTRIYGLSDAVADGETGVLVPPRDAAALQAALAALLTDAERRRKMGRAARKRCEELFDARRINGLLADEYRALTGAAV